MDKIKFCLKDLQGTRELLRESSLRPAWRTENLSVTLHC